MTESRSGDSPAIPKRRRPRVGLVLGSGSARGWAHIGVIRVLEREGVRPDFICGTSVGALVGAAYAAGSFDRFEDWVVSMRRSDVISLMDVGLAGGLLKGARLMATVRRTFEDCRIEDLERPFGAVATALHTGAEVWLREGSMLEAVRASIAMPGLFTPVLRDETVLVDGALVNPVPVSLGRAMGGEILIAVDLSSDILARHLVISAQEEAPVGHVSDWMRRIWPSSEGPKRPSMASVIISGLNIMQVRITRSRMAGEPPDVIVAPRLAHLGLLDYHRAEEAIREGERAMEAALEGLRLLGIGGEGD
jgi:NTE family protein